jgi:hypothetical protein
MHLHWLDCVALLAYLSTIAVNGIRLAKHFYRRHR